MDMSAGSEPEPESERLRRHIAADWRTQMDVARGGSSRAANLLAFWSRYKFVVLACDERLYRQIGPLLADLSNDVQTRAEQVLEKIMAAAAQAPSRQNHVNALQHLAGFITRFLDANEKQAWLAALADYQAGRVEFSAAASLLQEHLQRFGGDYVRAQHYPRWFLQYPGCEQ
jgi:uncharacterized protein YbgA (DUF1722 family)